MLIIFSDYWCLMNGWKINDVREDVRGWKRNDLEIDRRKERKNCN